MHGLNMKFRLVYVYVWTTDLRNWAQSRIQQETCASWLISLLFKLQNFNVIQIPSEKGTHYFSDRLIH